jgi:hypothetical protein
METDSSKGTDGINANGNSESTGIENSQSHNYQSTTRTMFLEYDRWKEGQHGISAIGKEQGDKRGKVYARIFIDRTDGKMTYIAKDAEGNEIERGDKLWELKKKIRSQAKPLLEKAKQVKRIVSKEAQKINELGNTPLVNEAQDIGLKVLDETHEFAHQTKDILHGTKTRKSELISIRERKYKRDKSKGRSR